MSGKSPCLSTAKFKLFFYLQGHFLNNTIITSMFTQLFTYTLFKQKKMFSNNALYVSRWLLDVICLGSFVPFSRLLQHVAWMRRLSLCSPHICDCALCSNVTDRTSEVVGMPFEQTKHSPSPNQVKLRRYNRKRHVVRRLRRRPLLTITYFAL